MSRKHRSFFSLTSNENVNQLQDNLIEKDQQTLFMDSIKQMQTLFMKNKVLEQLIHEQKQKKCQVKQNIRDTKKRITQIKQLNNIVDKQTSLIKDQTTKVKDVLMLNKILMMERVIRMQRQAQQLQRKRQICQKVKTQKQINQNTKKLKIQQKLERIKLQSLNSSFNMKNQLDQIRCNTMQMKRRQADQIKQIHERQRARSRKINSYKQERARRNYLAKYEELKNQIDQKQCQLLSMARLEAQKQVRVAVTEKIGGEYLHSFFATQATTL